jgi:hypothetical protein
MRKLSSIYFFIFILIFIFQGCATTQNSISEQRRKLILAQLLLEDNKAPAAKEILVSLGNGTKITGVTDEALFRLALLNLEPGEQKITTEKAGQNLDKLLKEYPESPWKTHALTLKRMIDVYEVTLNEKTEMEKTIRNLKNSNSMLKNANTSLTKENKELRQGIEKLKNLDLELEKKKR